MPIRWQLALYLAVFCGGVFGYFAAEKGVGQTALQAYSHSLSQIDGHRCPGYPVCSLYARNAYSEFGGSIATALMVDRLLREWREIEDKERTVWAEGKQRYFDPLERNTFWIEQ